MTSATGRADPTWQDGFPHVLWRAQQAVHRHTQSAVEGLGVTLTQLGLAVHLDELGLMSASDLARLFRLTPQSVTTALGQLERLGWVRRLPHPVHKRVVLHELTETGLAGVADGRARIAEADAALGEILGEDRAATMATLRRLTIALEGEDPSSASLWPVVRAAP
ncbi:MarR family winged helix-turn-helix transcriptional regulator [Streptomyces sp. 4N124]|uniref:MarR family winged helix-turn-helix transcriptional regulator n=1 Tax=Streptomyces sp. 4N124 TaxID=3457420 RepID=UPI003FD3F0F1